MGNTYLVLSKLGGHTYLVLAKLGGHTYLVLAKLGGGGTEHGTRNRTLANISIDTFGFRGGVLHCRSAELDRSIMRLLAFFMVLYNNRRDGTMGDKLKVYKFN